MFDNIIDKINLGAKQQLLAFIILWFAIYGTVWTIIEPLNIAWITGNLELWRWLFITGTFAICTGIYFSFFFRRKLECFGFEAGDTNLRTSIINHGTPTLNEVIVGTHDKLLDIQANYHTDPMDWAIKASANKAQFLTIVFKSDPDLKFYARVNVLSKSKKSATQKWLRFEPAMSVPQSPNDDEEMGVPITATDNDGLVRITVNLPKIVTLAFGSHGWTYDKVIYVRARGSGKIKSIILK
jgi:hypothetical protein